MNKIRKLLIALSLCFIFLIGSKMDYYAAGASLSGPSLVRAGDTITLTLNVSDSGKYGMEGSLSYDSSVVSLVDISCGMSGWKVETNGNSLIVYDDAMANPLNGSGSLLTLKFKINDGVGAGSSVNISVNGILTTDGSSESSIGTASYSISVAPPLSSNANLSSLSVSEGTLNPNFSSGTTSYNIGEVEYSVSKLNILYTTEDGKSSVSVSGNNLKVGANTVSVTVKAENGATKTYKIQVTRKQDPNYVPSSNASLSELYLSAGMVSPFFSTDIMDYIVYLPYEYVGAEFTAAGVAVDPLAQGVANGTIPQLLEGVNETSVVCKAEDGTEKIYKITIVTMPQYNGVVPNIEGVELEEEDTEFEPSTEDDIRENSGNDNDIVGTIAIVVVIILMGALVYVLFFLNKRKRI